jgi:hypothetical protein
MKSSRIPFLMCLSILMTLATAGEAWAQFQDARNPPPAGWSGPVFKLKQDYPQTRPALGARPWMQFDFRTQPNQYMQAVLGYVLEGNKEADFVVQNNNVRGWYHAPWMHTGPAGREFIRGLTRERSSRPRELSACTTHAAVIRWAACGPTPTAPILTWRAFQPVRSAPNSSLRRLQ